MNNQVHVKFFAIFREYIGLKEDWREIEPGMTVQELWDAYVARAKNPRVGNIRAAFSVNQRLAKPETVLNGGEEVGFLPPVSGGAGKRPERLPKLAPRPPQEKPAPHKDARKKHSENRPRPSPSPARDFTVTSNTLSLDALVARVSHPGAGGIATFLGVVRDNANDKQVKFLEYEAYPELAERMLAQIGAEVKERWSDVRIAIVHRTGRLKIGEASVIIAVSAPHRAEAFAACRYAIERLKVIVPVWKKEFASDTDYWVEGPTAGDVPPDKADEIVAAQENEFVMPQKKFGVLSADEGVGEIRTDLESV
jgi:molybdopterin synthase catalytic subunit